MTGYTHELVEKDQAFKQFAMSCAKAFGACITMRDEPADKPIPEKFEATDYHAKALAEANREHARLLAMSNGERLEFGQRAKRDAIKRYEDMIAKDERNVAKLRETLAQVEAWQPPTPDHREFKQFMVQQITVSIEHETSTYAIESLAKAKAQSPVQFFAEAITKAEWDINYHTRENAGEIERVSTRNAWVAALRRALT